MSNLFLYLQSQHLTFYQKKPFFKANYYEHSEHHDLLGGKTPW